MKGLVTICLAGSLAFGVLAPAAAPASDPRRHAADEPTAVERLIRQEDARRHDLRLGITRATTAITVPDAPRIEVVTRDRFDWLDAVFGALGAVVVVAAAALAMLLVREREPRHA